MGKITEKHAVRSFTILFTFLYMISYVTRINYAAIISEIVSSEGVQRSVASAALTSSALTYGFGQIISGFLGDRTDPKKLILAGLITTTLTNFILPFCHVGYQTAILWGINGLAQAFMWPPLVRIVSTLFTENDYKKACTTISCGSLVGTIAVYSVSPLLIWLLGWKSVFFVSGACAVIMSVIWVKKSKTYSVTQTKNASSASEGKAHFSVRIAILLAAILLAIILQGILRDGVTTWMPSYISEIFRLSNETAILTGVLLPLFSVAILQLVSLINRRLVRNELQLSALLFAFGFVSAFLLFASNGRSAVLSVFLSAILEGTMHGVNLILISMLPPCFSRFGKISFMSGLLNFCAYIGSAFSASGLALFSESYGWDNTLLLWALIALLGSVICFAVTRLWSSFKSKNN